MRAIYTLVFLSLFTMSCKNIQKMVEKGEYDKAIIYAAEKLHGEKNKKTKYVTALEDAFTKVTSRDMDRIAFMIEKDNPANWDRIYNAYDLIADRQERIRPFLPLVSEDGYTAHFKFVKTHKLMAEAAKNASEYHYASAEKSLERAREGDKLAARRAFDKLDNINRYDVNYKDKDLLVEEALFLGKTRVLLDIVNEEYLPRWIEEDLRILDIHDLESRWIEYYNDYSDDVEMDVKTSIVIHDMDVSPERENVFHHVDRAKVEDGYRYVSEKYTEVDSAGVAVERVRKKKEKKFKTVKAHVEEVHRFKEAAIEGELVIVDLRTGELLSRRDHNVNATFDDKGFYYHGDARALCGKHSSHIHYVASFPSDRELASVATANLRHEIRTDLRELIF